MRMGGAIERNVWIWGLPLKPFTTAQTLDRIAQLIARRKPSFFITANLHYAMVSERDSRLKLVNALADFVVADGMPLVWASRLIGEPLPERVAGSDLIWRMCERAAVHGWRVFLFGGAPGIAEEAARNLVEKYANLVVAGTACPPFRNLTRAEEDALIAVIRDSRADVLLVALGQPKGELWLSRQYEKLSIPVSVQIGASLDFVAGKVRRAPRWMQAVGLEWAYRLFQEPRRLLGRYLQNLLFLLRMLLTQTRRRYPRRKSQPNNSAGVCIPSTREI